MYSFVSFFVRGGENGWTGRNESERERKRERESGGWGRGERDR